MRLLLAALVLLPLAAPAGAQSDALGRRIEAVLDADDFADAFWGVLVVDVATGESVYARHAGKRFVPASNQKLFTTAAVLDALGPGFRYTTRLYADGPISGGVLRGDLVVQGAGDPTLGGRYADGDETATFRAWADSLRARGITRVTGDLIGDDDVFDDEALLPGWSWDDLAFDYGAEVSGLQFNEGVVEFSVRGTTAGRRATVSWEPSSTDYVDVENATTTRGGETAVRERYRRALGTNDVVVDADVPAGGTAAERIAVHNPTRYFVHTLRAVLAEAGIRVEGAAHDVDDRDGRLDYTRMERVASHRSPPLADIIEETNLRSNNLYAEQLLRTLGAVRFRSENGVTPGSARSGLDAMDPFLTRVGIDAERIHLVDGSGLSTMNRVTPREIVAVLRAMDRHADPAVREAFVGSLPVGGRSGTLAGRFADGPARGNVQAKTGFVNGVRTLSGYVGTAGGRRLAFALLCNHYTAPTSRVNAAQDAVVNLLAGSR